ncbi:MAG: hypothetical protein V3V75_00095 [Thermoguttaceae bacterium]
MDFQQRLAKAIERGHRRSIERARAEAEKEITEKELARLHSQYRLELSEHIEKCLKQTADNFPGFRFETIVGDRGWGASVRRDDIRLQGGRRDNLFSRLQVLVRPASSYEVLDLIGKATVRNKELFNRNHFQRLTEVDLATFNEMIDHWVLEYAEAFAAGN